MGVGAVGLVMTKQATTTVFDDIISAALRLTETRAREAEAITSGVMRAKGHIDKLADRVVALDAERDQLADRVAELEAIAGERNLLNGLLNDVRIAIPSDVYGRAANPAGRVRELAADRDRLNNRVSQLSAALTKSQDESARLAERVAELEGELDNLTDDATTPDISDETVQMLARAIDERCQRLIDRALAALADPDLGK